MKAENYAAVIVFGYSRKEKLEKCLEYLEKNSGIEKMDLHIFSDGAKGVKDIELVNDVRIYLDTYSKKSNFKTVNIYKSEKNKGLATSIIEGVSQIIDKYGKAIIVEDDLLTSDDFLQYMNDALEYYEDKKEYGSISGYTYPLKELENYNKDIYVTRKGECWGWGTWKDRWEKVDWNISTFSEYMNNSEMRKEFDRIEYGLDNMLIQQMNSKIDSWAVRWCYHLFRNNLLTVYPKKSRTTNIGFDGTGIHCGITNKYDNDITQKIGKCIFERLDVNEELERKASEYVQGK